MGYTGEIPSLGSQTIFLLLQKLDIGIGGEDLKELKIASDCASGDIEPGGHDVSSISI